jgi:Tfp pilus assembly protein PilF
LAKALFPRVVALLPEAVRNSAATLDPPTNEEADRLLALTAHDQQRVARTVVDWLGQAPFTGRIDNNEQIQAMRREAAGDDKPEETDAAYRQAIAKAPDDRWLHFNYGLFLEPRDPAAAAAEFRRALDLLPTNYEAGEKLADALIDQKKYDEAIAECRELLRQMPFHAPAYLTMAYAQAQSGAFDESIASYRKAIDLHPVYAPDAYNQIGVIQLHQDKADAAVASFEKAIAAAKGKTRTAELSNNLGFALQKLGRYAEARRVLEGAAPGPSSTSKTEGTTQGEGSPASASP